MNDSASPLDALKPLAGRALEAALNRALALDPDTRAGLSALDGRSIALHLAEPPLAARILVAGERLEVGPVRSSDEPDLSVRSTLGAIFAQLPSLLGAARNEQAAPVGKLRIEGDADLARRLQRLAERFDPDWQQPFTAVFGDLVGVQIANAVAGALRHARDAAGAFASNAAEYLTEESRDLVPRAELDAFHDDVDALRDDVERAAARVVRLSARAGERA
ncbi:ubiquinone biosynthesis accessory factor UbiJ [Lysobacter enzymogenes]|uniref:ubiquinone biosynthesis accessory factor UbiJ n=1 Tax=Lysobacter enzymogenes TaxID=69 RepID=UPI000896F454|nr:SCP2 sterol-binding domain-containing protein [Lysobacter enzymogenes]SDX81248.1 ubiquinone biosynthesis protein UbiJ [Lysobacter enzymogenes]